MRTFLAIVLCVLPLRPAAAADASWDRLAGRLRAVAETYKKWGVTFEVNEAAFSANPDFCPSKFTVSGGMESPDSVRMDIEAELGRKEALAVAISGAYKMDPNGRDVSGKGIMRVKGSGASYKFSYNSADGFALETGLEETFYSVGVKVGGDGRSPLNLGLKLGPATVKIDPVKWISRCREVGPALARGVGGAAGREVGGVMIQTDLEFMAAALSRAPPPSTLRLRDVTGVSLKRLLLASKAGRQAMLGPLTSVVGVAVDAGAADVILIGRVEPGMPRIPVTLLSALLRSVWMDGLEPLVSLDPAPSGAEIRLKPRIGGLAKGVEQSALVSLMLEADYRMKGALYGDVPAKGVTPIPTLLARSTEIGGSGSARFWFTPRPLETGDIGVIRSGAPSDGGSLVTFDVRPMVLTEKTTGGLGPDPFGETPSDPMERILVRAAAEFTLAYPELERTLPGLKLKELRQIFELATASAILRREVKDRDSPCARLLEKTAALDVPTVGIPASYAPIHKEFESAGGRGAIQLWGGVTSGAASVAAARMRVEKSLSGLLSRIRNADWEGVWVPLPGLFDPVVADAQALDRAESALSLLAVGERYVHEGSYDQALTSLDRAIEMDPANVRALQVRSALHTHRERFAAGAADADAAVRLAPNDATGYYLRAYAEMDLGREDNALRDLAEAMRLRPGWPDPYVVRGLLRTLTDPAGAIQDFDEALKTAKAQSPALTMRGLARLKQGDTDSALLDFNAAIRTDPRNIGPIEHRAALKAAGKDHHAVLEDRKRLVELQPTAVRYADLALAKLMLDDFPGAIEETTRALGLDPRYARAYQLRGRAKFEMAHYREALPDFEAALLHETSPFLRGLYEREIAECRKKIEPEP
ncbi:MAG TPA: tetratricopeptide repeat protein [Longimicrobiaceae bacterium]|nr:tetratricopeptide repeat protein [Longimicrobiaceae bacterium]